MKSNQQAQSDYRREFSAVKQDFSLSKAVSKIAHEIDRVLDHGYSYEDVMVMLRNENIQKVLKVQSSGNISNVAIKLLPKLDGSNKSSCFEAMPSYNDSNRIPDHATRWNSR